MNSLQNGASKQRKWQIVLLLSLGMVIAYVDRTNLSVVLAYADFKRTFALNDVDRGLLSSAFFWSYAVLQIPAGWIVDRYGARLPYAVGFLLWSLSSALTGLVQNMSQLTAMRLLLGAGESVSTAASLRWIRFNCAERERGLATGILFAGTKFGAAAGIPLAAWLLVRYGWRGMFLILGVGGLVWLAAWLLLVRKDPDSQAPRTPVSAVPTSGSFLPLLKTRTMWGIILGTFAYNYFIYYCLTWLPPYLIESRHLSMYAMSVYTMFSFSGIAIVGVLAGWWSDRLIKRGSDPVRIRRLFTLFGFIAASTEVIGGIVPGQGVSLFFAFFSLSGLGLATGNYWALTQTLIPQNMIGRAVGVQNFASNCSGIVAPIVTGWLIKQTGSYQAPMIVVLVVLLTGLFAYGVLVRAPKANFASAAATVRTSA